ncbi:hypothetical protein, partial [Brucella endophytica]|uniref:hypothetical protein n=1 Tax=Brucella endophytica TaxID=1963359 RepID=UPI0035BBBAA3
TAPLGAGTKWRAVWRGYFASRCKARLAGRRKITAPDRCGWTIETQSSSGHTRSIETALDAPKRKAEVSLTWPLLIGGVNEIPMATTALSGMCLTDLTALPGRIRGRLCQTSRPHLSSAMAGAVALRTTLQQWCGLH